MAIEGGNMNYKQVWMVGSLAGPGVRSDKISFPPPFLIMFPGHPCQIQANTRRSGCLCRSHGCLKAGRASSGPWIPKFPTSEPRKLGYMQGNGDEERSCRTRTRMMRFLVLQTRSGRRKTPLFFSSDSKR